MRAFSKLLCVLALGLVVCLPGMAGAVTSIGEPQITGSWSQQWRENNVSGGFDTIEVFLISPASVDFEYPGLRGFSTGTWTSSDPNVKYAVASASSNQTDVTFFTWFTGNTTIGTTIDFFAWNGGVLNDNSPADYARFIYTGSSSDPYGWQYSPDVRDPNGVDYNRVPLPPSVMLLGSGLMGLGLLGWRRKSS